MMKNNKLELTPSEINKFIYCPYQWYYERKYGSAELRKLASARFGSGEFNTAKSNFVRGAKYHSGFLKRYLFKRRLIVFTVAVVIILLFLFYWMFTNGKI